MGKVKLNSIYMCDDVEGLEQYRKKLLDAVECRVSYPMEKELPEIYIIGNREIDLGKEFGEPYYSEIDIDLITSTNTSSCGKLYSNYERIINSMQYIKEKKCKPIEVYKVGDCYHINNGKHRFLAYSLLGEKLIPVSVREIDLEKHKMSYSMVGYKRNLYSDDGSDISYPEKALEFFDINKNLFRDIVRVEMKCLEEQKRYCLELTKISGDIIEFKNGVSAGNEFRSSEVAKEIISRCGYDIDMDFIKTNAEFMLEGKHDAHNIVFDINITLDQETKQYLMEKVDTIQYYQYDSEKLKDVKIGKLHNFLSGYKLFGTTYTHQTLYNSGSIYDNENVYYFVGSDSIMGEGNYIYVFNEKEIQESNLRIKYLGRIGKEDDLYMKISGKR